MATQPITQRCEKCRFWQERDYEVNAEGRVLYRDSVMVCKRNPPLAPWQANQLHPVRSQNLGRYPITLAHHWCGEYQPDKPDTISEAGAAIARQRLMGDEAAAQGVFDQFLEEKGV